MTIAPNWQQAERVAKEICSVWGADAPGGVIVAFDAEGDRLSVASGLENLSTGKAFSDQSVGRFASITKHLFCTLVLQHPDLLSVDDRLGAHLPELGEPLASVTVGQALDMSGGLPDMRECLSLLGLSVYTETSEEANHAFMVRQRRLNFDAGTEVSYSNTGYRLVEMILKRKGVLLRDFLKDTINSELGTAFDAPHVWAEPVKDLCPGYWFDGNTWLQSAAGLQISASGSVTTSASGMSKWLRTLMAGKGKWAGILDQLSAPRKLENGTVTGYGLGITDTLLGDSVLIGHGGSHPGYKAYIMMDRPTGTGIVFLSNRDDADSRDTASRVMAALLDLPMPKPAPRRLPEGLYVAETGPFWLEVADGNATWLDDASGLYEEGDNKVSTRSATSQLELKWDGEALVGTVGYVPRHLVRATAETVCDQLNGLWRSDEGAFLEISNGSLTMGVGPIRQTVPLTSIGGGRYLFTITDSLWTKRVCLNCLETDRIELALSRARMIEYKRVR
ncbi:serine hydrolase domain-containing protein [Cohaesibacter marisflavi]|uniref:serine hydrolase domain-containing protein n=1 Tax=Cohaesibacter marisflavi TaxID=655353 RepID=UPI0029C6F280|nr:serine hydrolase domain-containing protein [Cohaesibacter marisflavi]